MDQFPKYNGTVHPDEWLKEVQSRCIINNVQQDRDILKLCKLNIGPAIKLAGEINTIPELSKSLKEHSSFKIFKSDCKERLDKMEFEDGDTAKFLADFRALINNAEIVNPEEIRKRLLNSYSTNEFFRNEYAKRVSRTTPIDDMFRIYSDVVSDDSKVIKYSSGSSEVPVTIKHVATGKYLTSLNVNYQTGSERQVVFCGEKLPNENAVWFITYEKKPQREEKYQADIVLYQDLINLTHQKTGATLSLNGFYRSPKSGNSEVHCHRFIGSNMSCIKTSQSINKTPYLKSGDIINIKSENNTFSLSSHETTFTIGDKSYQEVDGHKEKIGKNDEWRIELHR